ncbi:Myb-like protein J [Gracilariopsis chorda]|uniref:Myb-like protein J n=1 Tax=Gracilariopsis chorda TaxID=448386 RepID=A0A2V3IIB7_9FLOR|nr:Myb-like protein J [Gracilariopsis chorda]|eukprot:PXF41827.1 Myb-like protein J [Gracilariopsis chorda]
MSSPRRIAPAPSPPQQSPQKPPPPPKPNLPVARPPISKAPPPPKPSPSPTVTRPLKAHDVIFVNGQPFNNRGYRVCGVANQRGRLCGRIGTCPFHAAQKRPRPTADPSQPPPKPPNAAVLNLPAPPEKARFKRSWTPHEHRLFLRAMRRHGKGKWKEIAAEVATRTANQCQSHAQKYFLRQAKSDNERKKKSIHDIHDIVEDNPQQQQQQHSTSKTPAAPTPSQKKPTAIAPAPPPMQPTPLAPAPPSIHPSIQYAPLLRHFLPSQIPHPSHAAIIAPPPPQRLRVTVHLNGHATQGMALLVPHTLNAFFELAKSKLKSHQHLTRIFTRSGGEITDVDELCQDDMLWLSSGEDFLTPK